MTIRKVVKAGLLSAVGFVTVLGVAYLFLRLVGITTPGACISEEMETLPDMSGAKVEVVYTGCHTIAKDETISVYFSRAAVNGESLFAKWVNGRTVVFRYDPGHPTSLPAIELGGKDRVVISIPEVSSVVLRRQRWRNLTIDYTIGHIDYPSL